MPDALLMDMFRLNDAVAVVTGGASGIGLATVRALSAAGATVTVLDRADLSEVKLEGCHTAVLDVSDAAAVSESFDLIQKRHGRIDVLVNCAGIAIRQPATDVTIEDWDRVVAVNMTGSFLCARAAARATDCGATRRIDRKRCFDHGAVRRRTVSEHLVPDDKGRDRQHDASPRR